MPNNNHTLSCLKNVEKGFKNNAIELAKCIDGCLFFIIGVFSFIKKNAKENIFDVL